MNILATAVATEDRIETVDTIEYAGHLWLVTHWADTADGTLTIPTRLVCLSLLPHQKMAGHQHDYVLNTPLPKEIFDYDAPPPEAPGLLVLDPLRLKRPRTRVAN